MPRKKPAVVKVVCPECGSDVCPVLHAPVFQVEQGGLQALLQHHCLCGHRWHTPWRPDYVDDVGFVLEGSG